MGAEAPHRRHTLRRSAARRSHRFGTSANARQGQAQVHFLTGFLGHQDAYVVWVPGRDPVLILRNPGTSHGPVPDFVFERNMTLVIQPNIITNDKRAGVQVRELVRVTDDGVVSLHRVPQRLFAGGAPTLPSPASGGGELP